MPIPDYLQGDPEYVYPLLKDLIKVNIHDLSTSREAPVYPIDFLPGMASIYWRDLTWLIGTYPQPEIQDFGWWICDYRIQTHGEFERFTTEHRVPIRASKTVDTWYDIEPWTAEEIETEMLRRIEVFKSEINPFVRQQLQQFAELRNYDNICNACTYALGTDPVFKAEGDRAVLLRDQMWRRMYNIIKDVEDRIIPIPQPEELESLGWPALVWEVGPADDPEVEDPPIPVTPPIDPINNFEE